MSPSEPLPSAELRLLTVLLPGDEALAAALLTLSASAPASAAVPQLVPTVPSSVAALHETPAAFLRCIGPTKAIK